MEKTTYPTGKKIILFGHQNLQNSIFIGYLHQRVGVECQLINQPIWQDAWSKENRHILALIDADLTRSDLLQQLLVEILESAPNTQVAFFGVRPNHAVEKLITWPIVTGLFYSDSSQQQLSKGIQALFEGEYWLPRHLVAHYLQRTRQKPRFCTSPDIVLTKREEQILRLTATGATNTEIAANLSVSMHTVKTHIYNLFKKIGVANRVQAVNWAKDYLAGIGEFTS